MQGKKDDGTRGKFVSCHSGSIYRLKAPVPIKRRESRLSLSLQDPEGQPAYTMPLVGEKWDMEAIVPIGDES